ncbi:aminoglycoside 6-adenylyltransferase [Pontibacillus sp. HMF3514]|uniref:aminoglycoside 6-adenylyltransferase n=1 Tax=Pontibacillus sp. HMF3514 TaxID=2692425 RepID=UPI00131FC3CA|nr:aminoglycoside 6-adenylyltransferase [Pontibacillus sp. HMF3514]QHE51264.1 oxalate:formate antiporter [Pontibacillus sp. HMF3514]
MNALPIHQSFVDKVIEKTKQDQRLVGVAMGGSWLFGDMDEFSDLDFVIVYDPKYKEEIMHNRDAFAGQFGDLLSSFTGEHVDEPRLIVCLYNDPLLHVDYKFITLDELSVRVEDPAILWERDSALSQVIVQTKTSFPYPDFQYIEDRFWPWIHYCSVKLGRGEIFDLLGTIHFFMNHIIGPMVKIKNGYKPNGTRHLEKQAGEYYDRLVACAPAHDEKDCAVALLTIVELYEELKEELMDETIQRNDRTKQVCEAYLKSITNKILQ